MFQDDTPTRQNDKVIPSNSMVSPNSDVSSKLPPETQRSEEPPAKESKTDHVIAPTETALNDVPTVPCDSPKVPCLTVTDDAGNLKTSDESTVEANDLASSVTENVETPTDADKSSEGEDVNKEIVAAEDGAKVEAADESVAVVAAPDESKAADSVDTRTDDKPSAAGDGPALVVGTDGPSEPTSDRVMNSEADIQKAEDVLEKIADEATGPSGASTAESEISVDKALDEGVSLPEEVTAQVDDATSAIEGEHSGAVDSQGTEELDKDFGTVESGDSCGPAKPVLGEEEVEADSKTIASQEKEPDSSDKIEQSGEDASDLLRPETDSIGDQPSKVQNIEAKEAKEEQENEEVLKQDTDDVANKDDQSEPVLSKAETGPSELVEKDHLGAGDADATSESKVEVPEKVVRDDSIAVAGTQDDKRLDASDVQPSDLPASAADIVSDHKAVESSDSEDHKTSETVHNSASDVCTPITSNGDSISATVVSRDKGLVTDHPKADSSTTSAVSENKDLPASAVPDIVLSCNDGKSLPTDGESSTRERLYAKREVKKDAKKGSTENLADDDRSGVAGDQSGGDVTKVKDVSAPTVVLRHKPKPDITITADDDDNDIKKQRVFVFSILYWLFVYSSFLL